MSTPPDRSGATPVSAIRNLGPAMQAACARAGIHSAQTLAQLGTDEAYHRLLRAGSRPHFITFYVIEMGLQGRPWTDCKGAEKRRLRARFDAVVAEAHDPARAALERLLDRIGLPAPPPARAPRA